jgi:hypothetical protein
MSQANVEAFASAMRSAQRAFNLGDFEAAFVGLAPGVQWESGPWVFDAETLKGREEVVRHFVGLRDAVDWQVEAVEFADVGDGCVVVHQSGRMRGRKTNIEGTLSFFQLWETGPDGRVIRVREFEAREEAVAAAVSSNTRPN